jgi:hypothetical protein
MATVVLLAGSTLLPGEAGAAINWGVGADLGLSIFMPSSDYPGAENITSFGWPLGGGIGRLFGGPASGGLRVSFTGDQPTHEVYLSSDLELISAGNAGSIHAFQLTANYQYNFNTTGGITPYVTGGLGMNSAGSSPESGSGVSATSVVFGAGVGISHSMANGVGRLRGEIRYDRQSEGADGSDVVLAKGGALGIKAGFDLWDRK